MYRIINKKKLFATMVADLLGDAIFFPKILFRKKEEIMPERIKEILVIRTAYIGDVVMTLPILKPLKELYPGARITFLTGQKAKEVLENNSYIDEILIYDVFWFYPKQFTSAVKEYMRFLKVLRAKRYDLVIEARADIRDIALLAFFSKSRYRVSYSVGGGGYLLTHIVPFKVIKHRIDYHLDIVRYLGAKVNSIEWGIYLTDKEKAVVDALLGGLKSELLIGIHPGGRKELKYWSSDNFARLTDSLISEFRAKVIFTGSPEDKPLVDEIIKRMKEEAVNLAGKTDLRLLSGLIGKFSLFICNDTAPLHIASCMKTPTVAIFGPSKSRETGPYGNIHRVVEKNLPCRYGCDEDVCNHPVLKECMNAIQVEDVLVTIREILEEIYNRVDCHEIQN